VNRSASRLERSIKMKKTEKTKSDRVGLLFDCDSCGKPIEKAAALLFSPPAIDTVRKHHLCGECYERIVHNFKVKTTGRRKNGK
jgi:hypothetical protein